VGGDKWLPAPIQLVHTFIAPTRNWMDTQQQLSRYISQQAEEIRLHCDKKRVQSLWPLAGNRNEGVAEVQAAWRTPW